MSKDMTPKELAQKTFPVNGDLQPDCLYNRFQRQAQDRLLYDLRSVIRGQLVKFGNTITSRKFPYAVCHGEDKPFATTKKSFSVEYIVNEFLAENGLNNNQVSNGESGC